MLQNTFNFHNVNRYFFYKKQFSEVFLKKYFFLIKHILKFVDILINKIAILGAMNNLYTDNDSLVGVHW